MKRTLGLVLVAALAALAALAPGCSSAHGDAAPRTTTLAASTTTTAPPTTVPTDQAFRTKVPGVLTVGTETLQPPWYIGGAPDDITQGFEYDLAKALAARLRIPKVRV